MSSLLIVSSLMSLLVIRLAAVAEPPATNSETSAQAKMVALFMADLPRKNVERRT